MQNNQARLKKILTFGMTGVGKSTFLNYLCGRIRFKPGGGAHAVTKEIQFAYGDPNTDVSDFLFIDCPGLKDTEGHDGIHMQELIQKVKSEEIKGINAILFLFDFNVKRFTDEFKMGVKRLAKMFTAPDLWKHVAFVFTSAFYYTPERAIEARKAQLKLNTPAEKGFYTQLMIFINEAVNELKQEEPEKYANAEVPPEINMYFVDSDLEMKCKPENKRTDDQIKNMLDWVRSLSFIDADSINPDFNPDYRKKVPFPEDKIVYRNGYYYYYKQYEYTDYSGNKVVKADAQWYYEKPPEVSYRTEYVYVQPEIKEPEKPAEKPPELILEKQPEKKVTSHGYGRRALISGLMAVGCVVAGALTGGVAAPIIYGINAGINGGNLIFNGVKKIDEIKERKNNQN